MSKRHQATIAAFVVTLLIVFTMDFAFTLYTAISGVSAVNTAFLSVFYLVLNVPCSLCFIKYGSSVAKSLLENYSISNGERFRSIIFAKRTALSGALGVVVLAGQVSAMEPTDVMMSLIVPTRCSSWRCTPYRRSRT